MSFPLLQTKLYAPPPRPHRVSRAHLLARLQDAVQQPLTLVCAPAGFGKTTLVCDWIAHTAHAVAWLSLDEDDNDPTRFLTYLVTALRTRQPELGESVLPLLAGSHVPSAKAILTLLLNDLGLLTTPLVLVLDDYHVVTAQPIQEAVSFLIDHLPPQARLILTTRIDPPLPLARWRARNHLTELRADDLRFLPDEATTFLNEVMGLQLTPTQIATLESRTEGWIAGLQLAALSMQGREDVAGFLRAFSGSHRHVLSYLVEEVLHRCPAGTLDFLLQSAILERLSAPLCDAVTDRTDSQHLLEQVEQANLFLIPLDDERRWYRYHHLFADMLRTRLHQSQPALVPELHRRASAWYAAAGQLELAVGHALAANDPDQAASLLEPVAFSLLLQQSEVLLMHRLLERLPITAILARPRLLLAYGTALLLTGQYAAAEQLLNQMPPVESDADLAGEYAGGVTLLHSAIARFQGKSEQTLVLAQRALQQLPQDALIFRTAALLNIGVAYLKQGETAAAHDALTATLALANESGAEYLALAALEELATDQARRGQLLQTKQTCEQALARAARWRGQPMPAAGLAAISIGEVLVEWNELARAAQVLTQGIQLLRSTSEPHLLARGYSALARQQWAAGTGAAAFVTLDEGEQWLTQMQLSAPTAHAWFAAQRARLHLRQSDLAAVRRWEGEIHPQGESPLAYLQQLTRVRLRLAQHLRERQPQSLLEAAALLAPLLTTAEGKGWNSHVIEILMLQAVIEQAQGQRTLAHHTLARALTLAEPEGYLRLFVDEGEAVRFLILDFRIWILQQPAAEQNRTLSAYADKILATFDPNPLQADQLVSSEQPKITTPKSQLQNLIEPLSDRELEVLHLVAAGLSNSQIAARLIVTTGTVKTHINHIFGKLGVQSRTQAAAQARLVGLL